MRDKRGERCLGCPGTNDEETLTVKTALMPIRKRKSEDFSRIDQRSFTAAAREGRKLTRPEIPERPIRDAMERRKRNKNHLAGQELFRRKLQDHKKRHFLSRLSCCSFFHSWKLLWFKVFKISTAELPESEKNLQGE